MNEILGTLLPPSETEINLLCLFLKAARALFNYKNKLNELETRIQKCEKQRVIVYGLLAASLLFAAITLIPRTRA